MIDRARLAELRASEERRFIELHPKSGQLFEKSKVNIEDKKQGGVVSIEFHNLEQLDSIIQVLSGGKSGF